MDQNEEGFSLVNVLIGFALLGGLALGVMQVMKNISNGQNHLNSVSDEMELKTEVRMILDDERYCRISFAGNGSPATPVTPVKFNKTSADEESEGLNVELWMSNQAGNIRTVKKLSATDSSKNTYGKLNIISMKLLFKNGVGSNYSQSTGHNDIGELRITYQRGKQNKISRFPVRVGLKTDSAGLSTILSCSREGTSGPVCRRIYHYSTDLPCVAGEILIETPSVVKATLIDQPISFTGCNVGASNFTFKCKTECEKIYPDKLFLNANGYNCHTPTGNGGCGCQMINSYPGFSCCKLM